MRRIGFILAAFFLTICLRGIAVENGGDSIDVQTLYNGRLWRNEYNVRGDQFLFSPEFLKGRMTISGKSFDNLKIKYDILTDELIIFTDRGIILQLNKELITLFSITHNNQEWQFKKLETDSINSLSGFVNVLYKGKTSLYVKYKKQLDIPSINNMYYSFSQTNNIYIEREGRLLKANTKGELLSLLKDHKQQVRSYIRTNKIEISRSNPQSYMPVVEYYDRLTH
jgi:hypothetical protein